MSKAKNAIDSTFRRILAYTYEIILSAIILVIICLPLVFTVPMWVQHVLLDTPLSDLLVNPNAWFGSGGAFWITIFLGIVAIVLGYVMVLKLSPGGEEAEEVDSKALEEEEAQPAEVEVAKEEPESPDENDNEPSDE
ncbi:MAG: hypothetical protein ACTSV9_08485 [Candidatus Thorarchaeota archaeon]